MKINYTKIKKFLHIGFFSLDVFVFLIVLFTTNSSSEKYKEYTAVSKFFLDLYILAIYAVLLLVTILPGLIYFRIKKYILFIFTDKGKVIISFAISLIYWFAKNKPQFVLGIILTITSIILLIYEFIFYFAKVDNFLSSKGIEFLNKGQSTFDMNSLEKKLANTITPMNAQNQRYENSKSDENNTEVDNNSNPQNPPSDQIQRDVEISSGYDKNPNMNTPIDNNNQGFGF
jgi:hypothetical protein